MPRLDLAATLDRLEAAYDQAGSAEANPPKAVLKLGWPDRFANVLAASLPDGRFGAKTVYVDEASGVTRGRVDLYAADGAPLASGDAAVVTPIRCGLMAALAMRLRGARMAREAIGVVGGGAIGRATLRVLHGLRGQLGHGQLVLKTRGRAPPGWSARARLPAGVFVTDALENLDGCDTIITCTNNQSPAFLLRPEQFRRPPRELIAFDTGWMVGPEFRERGSGWRLFADCPAHLLAHARDEFPFDARFASGLTMRPLDEIAYLGPEALTLTTLYGMALADLVTLEAVAAAEGAIAPAERVDALL